MTTTTSFGTWNNHGDKWNTSVEASIADAVSGGDPDWRERMEKAGAFAAIESDYRDAINDALPASIRLCGDEFIGPYYKADYDWDGDLNLSQLIEDIDLFAIVKRHDVDIPGVGARVTVPSYSVPEDWPNVGTVVEATDETVVVELANGRRQELPADEVTPA